MTKWRYNNKITLQWQNDEQELVRTVHLSVVCAIIVTAKNKTGKYQISLTWSLIQQPGLRVRMSFFVRKECFRHCAKTFLESTKIFSDAYKKKKDLYIYNYHCSSSPWRGCIKQSYDKNTRKYCFKTIGIVWAQYLRGPCIVRVFYATRPREVVSTAEDLWEWGWERTPIKNSCSRLNTKSLMVDNASKK